MKLLLEREEEFEDEKVYLKIFELFKSYLILISDKEQMGIGNVTLAIPPMNKEIRSTSTSHKLFGIEDNLLSTIIAEKCSYILDAPILLLIFIKNLKLSQNYIKLVVDFLNKSLQMISKD